MHNNNDYKGNRREYYHKSQFCWFTSFPISNVSFLYVTMIGKQSIKGSESRRVMESRLHGTRVRRDTGDFITGDPGSGQETCYN